MKYQIKLIIIALTVIVVSCQEQGDADIDPNISIRISILNKEGFDLLDIHNDINIVSDDIDIYELIEGEKIYWWTGSGGQLNSYGLFEISDELPFEKDSIYHIDFPIRRTYPANKLIIIDWQEYGVDTLHIELTPYEDDNEVLRFESLKYNGELQERVSDIIPKYFIVQKDIVSESEN